MTPAFLLICFAEDTFLNKLTLFHFNDSTLGWCRLGSSLPLTPLPSPPDSALRHSALHLLSFLITALSFTITGPLFFLLVPALQSIPSSYPIASPRFLLPPVTLETDVAFITLITNRRLLSACLATSDKSRASEGSHRLYVRGLHGCVTVSPAHSPPIPTSIWLDIHSHAMLRVQLSIMSHQWSTLPSHSSARRQKSHSDHWDACLQEQTALYDKHAESIAMS